MDDKIFKKLQRNVEKSIAHAQGNQVRGIRVHRVKVPEEVDVAAIRHRLHMTQEIFAATFGFSVSGLKKWEAKERTPEGPARVLLKMISKDAKTVLNLAN